MIYKASQGYQDGSFANYCTEDAESAPGAPPFPVPFMMGITTKWGVAFPDWKSQCLSITKNDDGTYTLLEQQIVGAMKADPAIEGTPFPAVEAAGDGRTDPAQARQDQEGCSTVEVLHMADGSSQEGGEHRARNRGHLGRSRGRERRCHPVSGGARNAPQSI